MKITIAAQKKKPHTNVFKVVLETYYGDADGDATVTRYVPEGKIKQMLAEITLVQEQFQGRGGCRRMYDQTNYFCMTYEAYEANGEKSDGYFDWLDSENDYPYDGDGEQNYSLRSYKIHWLDSNGDAFPVTVSELDDLKKECATLNKKHRLGDYKLWEDDLPELDDRFAAYRIDAIELVKKHS